MNSDCIKFEQDIRKMCHFQAQSTSAIFSCSLEILVLSDCNISSMKDSGSLKPAVGSAALVVSKTASTLPF